MTNPALLFVPPDKHLRAVPEQARGFPASISQWLRNSGTRDPLCGFESKPDCSFVKSFVNPSMDTCSYHYIPRGVSQQNFISWCFPRAAFQPQARTDVLVLEKAMSSVRPSLSVQDIQDFKDVL